MIASNYNLWSVAGFVYALAGAAIIVNTMFLAPAPTHLTVPKSGFRDPQTLRRMSAQWLDARVGAALLVIGFFLQATGAVGTSTLNTPAVFVLLGLTLFAGYYGLSRDLIIRPSGLRGRATAGTVIERRKRKSPRVGVKG